MIDFLLGYLVGMIITVVIIYFSIGLKNKE